MNSRRRVAAGLALGAAVLFGGVVLLPTRSWLGQRSEMAAAEVELAQLDSSNASLSAKIGDLSKPDTVERQARELYGFVYPGQESYTVPQRGAPHIELPPLWPFDRLSEPLNRAAQRRSVTEDLVAR